jgi:hypothetical protein
MSPAGTAEPQRCPTRSANSGGFDLPIKVFGSGRVPHVRPSVHGPKTDSSNALTACARIVDLGRSPSAHVSSSVGRGCARLFRPMYARANMGHPSRERDSLFAPTTTAPMNSTRVAPQPDFRSFGRTISSASKSMQVEQPCLPANSLEGQPGTHLNQPRTSGGGNLAIQRRR